MKKPSFNTRVRLDTFASPDPEGSGPRRASSAHTYRLLIFKDRLRIHEPHRAVLPHSPLQPPAPLRSAPLHLQQRNEIMENFRYAVNRFFQLSQPARFAESLATAGSPASRAPFSGARKSEILASRNAPRKRYFDKRITGA